MQRDFARWDAYDAKFIQEPFTLFSEFFDKHIIRRFAIERWARVAVKMRHDKIDLLLCEGIKRHAFLEDPSQIQMEALNMWLLARTVRIAVENSYASG